MKPCVNCGRELTDKTVCDKCRSAFGAPEDLDSLVNIFKVFKAITGDNEEE